MGSHLYIVPHSDELQAHYNIVLNYRNGQRKNPHGASAINRLTSPHYEICSCSFTGTCTSYGGEDIHVNVQHMESCPCIIDLLCSVFVERKAIATLTLHMVWYIARQVIDWDLSLHMCKYMSIGSYNLRGLLELVMLHGYFFFFFQLISYYIRNAPLVRAVRANWLPSKQ